MDPELQSLNEQYAIPGHVSFHNGPGGLAMAVINNAHALATMTLAGGHVLTYTPHGQKPVLWLSPNAAYIVGKPMRGGVPVCWPWFGPHPGEPEEKPMHGFARNQLWQMARTRALPDGATEVRMILRDTPETLALWPHAFELEIIATIGPQLHVGWVARNPGSQPYTYTGALHPYYTISDIRNISINGLAGTDYLDKVEDFARKHQDGDVHFTAETDRVYVDTATPVSITDSGLARVIHIAKQGSRTTVVWNPDDKDALMPDVGAGQHHCFVCAEAANAFEDAVTVEPGGEGRLSMEIWTAPLMSGEKA